VYAPMMNNQVQQAQYEKVTYRYVSLSIDSWINDHPNVFFPRRSFKRPEFASDVYFVGYALQVAADLRRRGCDIAHVYYFPQFIRIIKALNPSIRIVLHMHGEWLTQLNWTRIEYKLSKTDAVVSCSEYISGKIRERFPKFADRCATVFMGTDCGHFRSQKTDPMSDVEKRRRLLYVGRISPEKGVHVLLDALELVVAQYPDCLLEIIGRESIIPPEHLLELSDDPKIRALRPFYGRSYLAQLMEKRPSLLADHVIFRGPIPHSSVVDHYYNASVFVFPSFYESFGMAAIEAMACQLPVVATRAAAVPEVVEDGKTGILVEANDVVGLADAITRLLTNDRLRVSMGEAGRARVREMFSWEQVCKSLLQVYRVIS
jgi:glycosyltransferase involved in cell wall biosynthesis